MYCSTELYVIVSYCNLRNVCNVATCVWMKIPHGHKLREACVLPSYGHQRKKKLCKAGTDIRQSPQKMDSLAFQMMYCKPPLIMRDFCCCINFIKNSIFVQQDTFHILLDLLTCCIVLGDQLTCHLPPHLIQLALGLGLLLSLQKWLKLMEMQIQSLAVLMCLPASHTLQECVTWQNSWGILAAPLSNKRRNNEALIRDTPPKFNIAPENLPCQKERIVFQHLPTIIFQGRAVIFQGVSRWLIPVYQRI